MGTENTSCRHNVFTAFCGRQMFSATRLTGFSFEILQVNYPRRTLLSNTSHPLTKGLSPATLLGGPLAYGPVLFPTDGTPLSMAWTKLGKKLTGGDSSLVALHSVVSGPKNRSHPGFPFPASPGEWLRRRF